MLTARGRPEDVLNGFGAGADDYLPKPTELAILLARIGSLLRRSVVERRPKRHDRYAFSGRTIDFDTLELTVGDRVLKLTLMEANLLRYLIEHEGKAVSRKAMLEQVWELARRHRHARDRQLHRPPAALHREGAGAAAAPADGARRRLSIRGESHEVRGNGMIAAFVLCAALRRPATRHRHRRGHRRRRAPAVAAPSSRRQATPATTHDQRADDGSWSPSRCAATGAEVTRARRGAGLRRRASATSPLPGRHRSAIELQPVGITERVTVTADAPTRLAVEISATSLDAPAMRLSPAADARRSAALGPRLQPVPAHVVTRRQSDDAGRDAARHVGVGRQPHARARRRRAA